MIRFKSDEYVHLKIFRFHTTFYCFCWFLQSLKICIGREITIQKKLSSTTFRTVQSVFKNTKISSLKKIPFRNPPKTSFDFSTYFRILNLLFFFTLQKNTLITVYSYITYRHVCDTQKLQFIMNLFYVS